MPTIESRLALTFVAACALCAAAPAVLGASKEPLPALKDAQGVIKDWPEASQLAADRMILKYGAPDEAGVTQLRWRAGQAGPWLSIVVHREGIIEQSVRYEVPYAQRADVDRLGLGVTYDPYYNALMASATSEELNVLALNVAVDVAEGRRTPEQAREFYAKTLDLHLSGKSSPYTRKLMFEPYLGYPLPFWMEQLPPR